MDTLIDADTIMTAVAAAALFVAGVLAPKMIALLRKLAGKTSTKIDDDIVDKIEEVVNTKLAEAKAKKTTKK
jgi:hypothetical protein